MNDGIKITPFENGLLIKIYGELDSFHVLGYKDKIVLEMKRYNPYLLLWDLKNVSLFDRAGIGLILGRYNEIRKVNGLCGFISLTTYTRKIIELTGLSKIIYEYKNLASFKKEGKVLL